MMDWPFSDATPSPSSQKQVEDPIDDYVNDPKYQRILGEFYETATQFDQSIQPKDQNASLTVVDRRLTPLYTELVSIDDSLEYQQSNTLSTVFTLSAVNESQDLQQGYSSKKVQIYTHPRAKFRPRTEKESRGSSHYIRCDDNVQPEYPSIRIPPSWKNTKNIIRVTLVDINKNPHPYTIESKERKTPNLIYKNKESNTLYYHVTDKDYEQGYKTFLIQYIKPKQDETITKVLIKNRQLHQSMFRFTRCYQINDDVYEDECTSEYSSIMTEDYGNFYVEDVFPLYGPMSGNEKVAIELRGHAPKDIRTNSIVHINGQQYQWYSHAEILEKRGNNLTFLMPKCPLDFLRHVTVEIIVKYNQDVLYQSEYTYVGDIDDVLMAMESSCKRQKTE